MTEKLKIYGLLIGLIILVIITVFEYVTGSYLIAEVVNGSAVNLVYFLAVLIISNAIGIGVIGTLLVAEIEGN